MSDIRAPESFNLLNVLQNRCKMLIKSRIFFNKFKNTLAPRFNPLFKDITVNWEAFAKNMFFANSVKRHIGHVKTSRLGHDLPTSVYDRVILPICEGFISRDFASANFRENRTLAKICEFTVWQSH